MSAKIDFWKNYDGTNNDDIPPIRGCLVQHLTFFNDYSFEGLDIERIKAYCKATGKDLCKEAINADFMNKMEEWYFDLAENYVKWTPVSERLPKENEYNGNVRKYYLVQDEYGDMFVAHFSHVGWIPIRSIKALSDEVVAWMPLPKEYKIEDN